MKYLHTISLEVEQVEGWPAGENEEACPDHTLYHVMVHNADLESKVIFTSLERNEAATICENLNQINGTI